MNVTTSNEMLTRLLELSATVVHGLGTSFLYDDKNILILNKIDGVLGELELVTEKMTPEEVALVKATQRMINKIDLAHQVDEAFLLEENVDLANYRDFMNFGALSKAVMAFVPAEPKVDHLKPTIYVWSEFVDEELRLSHKKDQENYWRCAIFVDGRPLITKDHRVSRSFYSERKSAIDDAFSTYEMYTKVDGRLIIPQVLDQCQPKPYLYILMRNDLQSMNAGKAVAQGTHAANQMVYEARKNYGAKAQFDAIDNPTVTTAYTLGVWESEANGFGTCITLSVDDKQMREAVAAAQNDGVHAGICHDPTYPLLDGKTLHLLPVDTCAYIFDWQHRAKKHTGNHPLMP